MEDEPADPAVHAAWKKDITNRLKQLVIFKQTIPAVLKRCPACHNLSLEFDPERSRIHCSRCGFEEHLRM